MFDPSRELDPVKVNLPPRVFLYTLDQIAGLTSIGLPSLRTNYIYYYGRSTGVRPKDRMMARNIATPDKPDWRVAESEFVRWLKNKHFVIEDRGWAKI